MLVVTSTSPLSSPAAQGGRRVHFGGEAGFLSGEGSGRSDTPRHRVKIMNLEEGTELEVEVPEDRYILWEAEDQGMELPYACRMGCCTACTVRIKEGEMFQPQSLGLSKELKEQVGRRSRARPVIILCRHNRIGAG